MTRLLRVYTSLEGHKPRLGGDVAWVTGLESLSTRFADVPQFDDLIVWFSDRPDLGWKRTVYELIRQQAPYQVFTVYYAVNPDPQWFLMVYPVKQHQRSQIRSELERTAFPIVDDWMCQSRSQHWLAQSRYLRCVYSPATEKFDVREDAD